jgi:predicted PurR-regulated permease PerM
VGYEEELLKTTRGMRVIRALGITAWLLVGVAAALWLLSQVAGTVSLVLIPLVLALFPAAVLHPLVEFLERHKVPPAAATLLVLVGAFAALGGLLTLVIRPMIDQIDDLRASVQAGITELNRFLERQDLNENFRSVDDLLDAAQQWAAEAQLTQNAVVAGSVLVQFGTGALLMLVALFFYLKDGRRIFRGIVDLLPREAQRHTEAVGARLWWTVGAYFRGQALVALIDAVFIGLGLVLLDVPLALPLASLVFLGGFFPIVGAFVTGLLAVLVALADGGIGLAVAVLVLILAVQQIEGNILQPIIMSRAISLHPLTVILAVAVGGVLLGILGAFLSVPIAAGIARAIDYVREQIDGEPADEELPDEVAEAPGGATAVEEPVSPS